jgi:uncharacterized protein involved in outer membrane biogenesis
MRGRRVVLALVWVGGVVVTLLALALISLPFVVDVPRMQELLRSEASRLLDRPVRFERVALSYWPLPAVRVVRLTVAGGPGFGPDPLLAVDEARVRVRLLPLLAGRLQFGEITLARPRVVVEQRRDGSWNLPSPSGGRPAPAAPFVLVSRVRLRDGRVEVRVAGDPGTPGAPAIAHLVDRIDLTLDDLGWSEPIGIKLTAHLPGGGITAEIEGTVGPLAQARGDLAGVPVRLAARFTAEEGRAASGAIGATGKGAGEVRVGGTLGQVTGGGQISFSRLVVTHRPTHCAAGAVRSLVLEDVSLPIQLDGPRLAFRPFQLRMAGGTVQGEATLTWQAGTPGVQLAGVRLRGVAAEPVLVDFLCQPYAVAGRLDASGEVAFVGIGDELLRSARGRWDVQVGAGRFVGPAVVKLMAGLVRVGAAVYSVVTLDAPRGVFASPTEFQSLAATGTIGGGRVQVREVKLTSSDLRVTGDGTYGLVDARLDFNVNIHAGRNTFAVKVAGTAAEPSYTLGSKSGLKSVGDAIGPLLERLRRPSGGTGGSPPAR